jgi:uncharacterized protein (DUF433 family)
MLHEYESTYGLINRLVGMRPPIHPSEDDAADDARGSQLPEPKKAEDEKEDQADNRRLPPSWSPRSGLDFVHVERIPGKVSGAWLVKGTHIPADAVLDNADDGNSAEEIVAVIYPSLPLDRAKRILVYARERPHVSNPA